MLSIQNIYDNIISQGFTWVKIQDLDNDLVAHLSGNTKKTYAPKEIKEYVVDFIKDNPGVYTFSFKKNFNSTNTIKYKKINCSSGLQVVSNFNEEEERNKIRLQLIEEEREKKLKFDYEQKILEMETVWGKIGWVVQKVFEQNNLLPKGMLNGQLNSTSTMPYNPIPLDTMTEEQKKLSNESLLLLLQCVNPETLHAVAVKLKNEPQTLQMLIKFVNP